MLQPVFGAREGPSLSPGVFSELRFDRNLLRPSFAGTPIAEQRDHVWHIEGKRYPQLDCTGRVALFFCAADGSLGPMYGPFDHLGAVDGVLYANRKRFATFDQAEGVWAIDHTELRCPMLAARAPDYV
jgi:hypothetical protein